ncbi:MAG: PEGA domain-containing protein [Minicystis sp.]
MKQVVFVLAFGLVACVSGAPPTTSLRVGGAPPDASVTIDDKYLGAFVYVQKRGVALPPGKHRITVEKSGYFPWDKLVEAHEGDPPLQLDVTLTKIPD